MSYKIGQFKRTDLQPAYYSEPITIESKNYGTFSSPYNETDDTIQDGALTGIEFKAGQIYVIDFTAQLEDAEKNDFKYIKIKLKKDNAGNDYQSIKLLNMINKTSLKSVIGFQPYTNYSALVLEAMRSTTTAVEGPKVVFASEGNDAVKLISLKNILDTKLFKGKKIMKIGIQGPEGLLFVVNGEAMRLGKSGMYVSREDMVIQSLGVAIEKDTNIILAPDGMGDGYQFFTIDYIYEEVVNNE